MESKVNFLFAVLAVVVIASVAMLTYSCSTPATPKYFPRKLSLDEAMSLAEQADRPVFALVTAEWSEPCQKFKRGTLADSRIAEWVTAHAQPVILDMTNYDSGDGDAAALFNRFAITEFPTILLIRKGQELGRIEKEVSARELLKWLNEKGLGSKPTPAG